MNHPGPSCLCWMDGRQVGVDQALIGVDDVALTAGLGLFETLAVHERRLLDLEPHLERMVRGAKCLGLSAPDPASLARLAQQGASALDNSPGWLKIILTGRERVIVLVDSLAASEVGRPSSAVIVPWRRSLRDPLVGLKTLSYAGNALALAWARQQGADEGLWLNSRGHLAEGCTSNLFVLRGRRLFTPGEGEGILPGVVRSVVLRAARGLGLDVHEGRVRLPRIREGTEAFLTSSVRGVRPLVALGGRPLGGGTAGSWTARIAADVERRRLDAAAAEP